MLSKIEALGESVLRHTRTNVAGVMIRALAWLRSEIRGTAEGLAVSGRDTEDRFCGPSSGF